MAEYIPDVQVAANTATPAASACSVAVDSVLKRLRTKDDAGQIRDYVTLDATESLSGKTLVSAVMSTGITATGSASNDWSASTGTWKSSTGANQLSGAVTVTDATTPSISLATGKTNTGFFLVNGKTSGSLKIICADAAAQAVTVNLAAQTSGASTLTIPDMAGAAQTFSFIGKTETLAGKTLTTPVIGVATGTSLAVTGLVTTSSASAAFGYATGAGGAVTQITSRSTGVTLNTNCGAITGNSTSLAAGGEAIFVVTNSSVALRDVVVISVVSGPTANTSVFSVSATAAGSFSIRIRNLHASTADTGAPIINFAIIKAVNS